jgi:dipeptidyl aminopeptidase/acylaminoacyl peptidase
MRRRTLLSTATVLALFCAVAPASLAQTRRPARKVSEKVVAQLEGDELPDSARASPDARRIAWTSTAGGRTSVFLDGKKQGEYGAVVDMLFSPDGKRFAFVALRQDGKKLALFLDGVESKGYDAFHQENRYFGPRGKHVAFSARDGDVFKIVRDGVESKGYRGSTGPPTISPDGKRIAFVAFPEPKPSGRMCMVVDGKEGPLYDGIDKRSPVFSADGRRIAYMAKKGDRFVVVVDGEESPEFDELSFPAFSPDGSRIAYFGVRDGVESLHVNGEKTADLLPGDFCEGVPYFSPDGKRLAYFFMRKEKWSLVLDGKPEGAWDNVGAGSLRFGPKGKRYAFVCFRGETSGMVVDGKEDFRGDGLAGPGFRFSPNGKKTIWAFRRGEEGVVVENGKEGKPWDGLGDAFVFDARSRHAAFAAKKDGKWTVVVDGKPGETYDFIVAFRRKYRGGGIVFDSPNAFHYLARRGKQVLLVEEKIR